jgi:hypothetical protein
MKHAELVANEDAITEVSLDQRSAEILESNSESDIPHRSATCPHPCDSWCV